MNTNIDDIFQRMLSVVDENKQLFTDGQYKNLVELIAAARKRVSKLYCVRVMAPDLGYGLGEIAWKSMLFHVALDDVKFETATTLRLIPISRLMGTAKYTIHENPLMTLTCSMLPIVDIQECKCDVDSDENLLFDGL